MLAALILALVLPLYADGNGFGFNLGLGSDLLPDPDNPGVSSSWFKLGARPELAIGKFAIGLDFTIRFQIDLDGDPQYVRIYEPDWIPRDGKTIFDLYLPKIMYVRYGYRGEDPFYIKLGSISDFMLGNGLIVDNYANTRFLPTQRLFGLEAGLDGELFGFPLVGFEVMAANLARLDVVGGRVYVRPLAVFGPSLFGRIQIGATAVFDNDPLLYVADPTPYEPASIVHVYGADVTFPILRGGLLSLTAFAEGAEEMNGARGLATGVRGALLRFIWYGAQIRWFQQGFIPSYFDTNYDLYRAERFKFVRDTAPGTEYVKSWLASLGFDLFAENLSFRATVDGPFSPIPATPSDDQTLYPHVRGRLIMKEGIIPHLRITGNYEKYYLGRQSGDIFKDLINFEDASIGLQVDYKVGFSMLTLYLTYIWDPVTSHFLTSSSLSVSIQF